MRTGPPRLPGWEHNICGLLPPRRGGALFRPEPRKLQLPAKHLAIIPLVLALEIPGVSQSSSAPPSPRDYSFNISTSQPWTDTGVDLQTADHLHITATPAGCDPQGASAPSAGNPPLPAALPGALIAKFQPPGAAVLVGATRDLNVTQAGRLFLGVNASGEPPCAGSFAVQVHVAPAANPDGSSASGAATSGSSTSQVADLKKKLQTAAQIWMAGQFGTETAGTTGSRSPATGNHDRPGDTASSGATNGEAAPEVSDAPLEPALRKDLEALPRRVNDEFKNLGDMVNFVLIGSQQQMQSALEAARWQLADTDTKEAALKAVLQTYEKQDYLAMPMSKLMLFGRYQDYGYEQAEPIAMVASRHHFRLWKAPFTWNGQMVWVGAGTHDIGFERDRRNGQITHKIDPAVDGERDNIGSSLQKAGRTRSLAYFLPSNPVQDARNATGGGYHSDGRILVVFLK
jgi:hypothetical protein